MLMAWIIVGVIFLVAVLVMINPTDNTDKSFFTRSGLSLYTDHKTGLQYIGGNGGITPRLDENGQHMKIRDHE